MMFSSFFNRKIPQGILIITLLSVNISMVLFAQKNDTSVISENASHESTLKNCAKNYENRLDNAIAQKNINLCNLVLALADFPIISSHIHIDTSNTNNYLLDQQHVSREYVYNLLPQKKPER